MNGAVAGSMRYYGADYGLNYGVSLQTIRSLATAEGKDHSFAKYLYQQEVREIRLSSLHIAQAECITACELPFWEKGIINSEVAEEAAFALFQYVEAVSEWLQSENDLLVYTALLSIAKSHSLKLDVLASVIMKIAQGESRLLASATTILLESYYRQEQWQKVINELLELLPEGKNAEYIRSEMEWRCELILEE